MGNFESNICFLPKIRNVKIGKFPGLSKICVFARETIALTFSIRTYPPYQLGPGLDVSLLLYPPYQVGSGS